MSLFLGGAIQANYKRDVAEWADAVILGSGVYNQNPAPQMLQVRVL